MEILAFIFNMNGMTQFTAFVVPVLSILLFILHKNLEKKKKSTLIWKLSCFLPLAICALHLYLNAFRGNVVLTLEYYLPFTIAAIFAVFLPLVAGDGDALKKQKRKRIYNIYAVSVIIISIVGSLDGLIYIAAVNSTSKISNHTAETYTESFHSVIQDFRENYVLSEWKEIDYDEIEARIMPKVQEAQDTQDEVLYCMALYEFIYRIHDDHVWIGSDSTRGAAVVAEAEKRLAGDDHGFAMFATSDGETIAVLVDEGSEAFEKGIRNGTVITKWNGEDVKSAASKVECICYFSNFPVAKNEEWVQPIFLAGHGGEQVEVSFLDEDGQEKTVQLQSTGSYRDRLGEALLLFCHQSYQTNFETKMLTETIGYLRINSEEYDLLKDVVSLARGSYPEIADMTSDKLDALKRQGMTSLVIDARNNSGGYATISSAITSLFTKERFFVSQFASSKRDRGRMKKSIYVEADGRWADLPVVLLTNYNCGSSGDGLVYTLGKCKNVTVMGITESAVFSSISAVSVI